MKNPEYKIGDQLNILKGDGTPIVATVKAVYPTAVPSYKLESDDVVIPLYLSEPVLQKLLQTLQKKVN